MILHIVIDDKFIDMAYNMFEKISPNNNEFMIVTNKKHFNYIKTTPITKISSREFLSKKFIDSLDRYEFIILHWLDTYKKKLLLKASKDIKFLWIGWGGDYYEYIDMPLLLPKTNQMQKKIVRRDILFLKKKVKYYIEKLFWDMNKDIESINRINYFAPVLENEFPLVKHSIKSFKPKFIDWNYGTLEDDLINGYKEKYVKNNNILIGNSATLENNHLESFDLLKEIDLDNKKIILPLSYGNKEYTDEIIKISSDLFGEKVEALTNFMPINEYIDKISSCSVVIMNHLRQQALGNIIIMLYLGAKVFLNKENPAYNFLIKHKIHIYTMEEFNNEIIKDQLDKNIIVNNRNILESIWGRDNALNKTKTLIKILTSNNMT